MHNPLCESHIASETITVAPDGQKATDKMKAGKTRCTETFKSEEERNTKWHRGVVHVTAVYLRGFF